MQTHVQSAPWPSKTHLQTLPFVPPRRTAHQKATGPPTLLATEVGLSQALQAIQTPTQPIHQTTWKGNKPRKDKNNVGTMSATAEEHQHAWTIATGLTQYHQLVPWFPP